MKALLKRRRIAARLAEIRATSWTLFPGKVLAVSGHQQARRAYLNDKETP